MTQADIDTLKAMLSTLRRRYRYVGYLDVQPPEGVRINSDKDHEFVASHKTATGVWIPGPRTRMRMLIGPWYSYKFITAVMGMPTRLLREAEAEKKTEPEFEVNMMEALTGWKAFCIEENVLRSASVKTQWLPDQPLIAKCDNAEAQHIKEESNSPMANCTCGIYGGEKRKSAEQYLGYHDVGSEADDNRFLGTIAGWGKYVRHADGWRAQYAYPQSFYLKHEQEKFVPILRKFHVPIFVETPFQVYSPEEDGYEHWTQEAYRNRGTAADSDASEEGSTDAEA